MFTIEGHRIGTGERCLVIGEVAQSHDGSLGMAHAFIDAIANAGADAVKFQTHIAAAESTPAETFRVHFSLQDSTRYEYWKRMEFTKEQWYGLARHARERGLIFLSSPFSVEAVELLVQAGVPAWKIASGEINNQLIFERIAETGLPVLLSTGMSSLDEIDEAVTRIKRWNLPYLIFQCSSCYPCPPEKVGLNLISFFRKRYDCPVGLSDHSGTIYPGIAAAATGVDMIEVHVTLSREMFGPDVSSSITTDELRQMVEGIRFIETMNKNPVNKDIMAGELESMRRLFFKSVVARLDLPAGTIIKKEHLSVKKPGDGIQANMLDKVVGCRLCRDIKKDEILRSSDLI